MEKTGKNNKVFTASNTPFLNSDLLFVEYFDVLKSPFFIFLFSALDNEDLNKIFDLEEIKKFNVFELYEWYIKRKRFNVFHNLPVREEAYTEIFHSSDEELMEWIDQFSQKIIDELPVLCNGYELNFQYTLFHIRRDKKILKKIMIYTPFYSDAIYNDILNTYGEGIEYVYGDIDDVLTDPENKITKNTTFVFSDVGKIYALQNAGLLEYSSVLIADKYGYNYNNYNDELVKFDLIKLREEVLFKLDFFNNIFGD